MGNIWSLHQLTPHPDFPPRSVQRVSVQLGPCDGRSIELDYTVSPRGAVFLPPPAKPVHTDGLWQTTCFEVFLKAPGNDAYLEFNFSPSRAWAGYRFDNPRQGMQALPMRVDPEITVSVEPEQHYHLTAEFDVSDALNGRVMLNATAVIEEIDGTKSYWALAHPAAGPPDFHDPACFTLELPPSPQSSPRT